MLRFLDRTAELWPIRIRKSQGTAELLKHWQIADYNYEPASLRCVPDEVHVWRIELDCASTSFAALKATLSPEEHLKAARFQIKEVCERWIVARGALCCILASYARSEPKSLVFRLGPYGLS